MKFSGLFHLFHKKYYFKVVLFEYPKNHYLWIGVWINKNQRGNNHLSILMNTVFNKVQGTHHIHFFPEIHTAKKIAKRMQWKYIGKSNVFEGCVNYEFRPKVKANNNLTELMWKKTSNFGSVRKLLYINELRNIVDNYKTPNKRIHADVRLRHEAASAGRR